MIVQYFVRITIKPIKTLVANSKSVQSWTKNIQMRDFTITKLELLFPTDNLKVVLFSL